MPDDTDIQDGIARRRRIMGEAHLTKMNAEDSGLLEPWQDFIHKNVWHDIWARPGLDERTRLLLNLAMLSALVRPNQLRMYIGVALRNGVKKEEIVEIFLQTAVYAGAPAGVEAFACLKQVLSEQEHQGAG